MHGQQSHVHFDNLIHLYFAEFFVLWSRNRETYDEILSVNYRIQPPISNEIDIYVFKIDFLMLAW